MLRMFSGSHERSIDPKWRVSLPPEFREGDRPDFGWVLGRVPGSPCLGLWGQKRFENAYERLQEQVRTGGVDQRLLRWFLGNGHQVRPDAQGRIVVPERLRDILGVDAAAGDARVFVAGVGERIEFWNVNVWLEQVGGADAFTGDGAPAGSTWL